MHGRQKLTRHNARAWSKVLSEELLEMNREQAEAHLAAAFKDVTEGAREEERDRCAEMVEEIILSLIERYLQVGSNRSPGALAKSIAALNEGPKLSGTNGREEAVPLEDLS